MPAYFASLTIVLLIGLVVARVLVLRKSGVDAMNFGKIDKTDFIIPPFVLFYFYLVFANTFHLPSPSHSELLHIEVIRWVGVFFGISGLILLLLAIISFGKSFRVGIDTDHPDQLVTSGVFAFSRNPLYVAFGIILLGQFLIFSNWILLVYFVAAIGLFHRQVLREENFLILHYGKEYSEYCRRVKRYLFFI